MIMIRMSFEKVYKNDYRNSIIQSTTKMIAAATIIKITTTT